MKKGRQKSKKSNSYRTPNKVKSGKTGRMPVYQDNVTRLEFRKPEKPLEGLNVYQKIRIFVAAVLVLMLATGAYFFIYSYKINDVRVEGSTHYTTDEMRDMVITDKFSENSLFLKLKLKHKKIDNIPFVEHMDVQILDRTTIKIIVYEKAIAGYVVFLENNMYFDKDGIVVESSKEKVPGLPEITGLEFDHVILHEPLPVENPKVFKEILNLTQLLNKQKMTADKIYFDYMGNVTLYFGKFRVLLGGDDYLEEKIMHLHGIWEETKDYEYVGRLHMETFSPTNPYHSFEPD